MTYVYEDEVKWVFTDKGQMQFLRIRDHVRGGLAITGAITGGCAIEGLSGGSWEMMACVDRLVELGEIREVTDNACAWQDRVFVDGR